jgi:REP element-mobilizing transposase RayT
LNLDFVSAYCLMINHFHLLLETPKPICPKPCASSTKRDSVIGKACLEFGYS